MNSIYTTTAAKMFRGLDAVAKKGVEELIGMEYRGSEKFIRMGQLATPSFENEDFPYFPYPITVVVDDRADLAQSYTIVDLRPFYNQKGEPRDLLNRQMVITQAALVRSWDLEPSSFDYVAGFTSAVFAHWISAALKTNFSLDVNEVATARTVAAAYYIKLFQQANERFRPSSKDDRREDTVSAVMRLATSRKLWNTAEQTEAVIRMEELTDFLESDNVDIALFLSTLTVALSATSSARMSRLSEGNLLTLLSRGAWLGYKAGPLVSAAVEFPPLLVHIIDEASRSRQLKDKTIIGRAVGVLDKDTTSIQTLNRLVAELKNEHTN